MMFVISGWKIESILDGCKFYNQSSHSLPSRGSATPDYAMSYELKLNGTT